MQPKILAYPGPWHVSLIIRRLLVRNIRALEYDPHTQYRFHQTFMTFWLICMVVAWFVPDFSQMNSRLIMEVSLYANFATDFGAMSSALAASSLHCPGCRCSGRGSHKRAPDEVDW